VLTRGRSVSAGSSSADEEALWEFLYSGGSVAAPLSIVCSGIIAPFMAVDVTEVDIVERRSLLATLEASERESSGLRGRPSCDGGIGGEGVVPCHVVCTSRCLQSCSLTQEADRNKVAKLDVK
jgi:hypothetical protein